MRAFGFGITFYPTVAVFLWLILYMVFGIHVRMSSVSAQRPCCQCSTDRAADEHQHVQRRLSLIMAPTNSSSATRNQHGEPDRQQRGHEEAGTMKRMSLTELMTLSP